MKDLDNRAFISLFKEACEKCFGHPLTNSLSETESKQFCNQLLEKTGLVIGPKSVKNYSLYVLNTESKSENPSPATLDTLARYVLDAPYTDEATRKSNENHYPYWFAYKDKFSHSTTTSTVTASSATIPVSPKRNYSLLIISTCIALAIVSILSFYFLSDGNNRITSFSEDFKSLQEDSLAQHGWFLKSREEQHWNRRNEKTGYLTLFTLRGDNWPDSSQSAEIKNLLLRKVESECFTAEVHFKQFIPQHNWQQAGILLLEDSTFSGKSLRLSLAYNDFFGGYSRPKEILIQVITSRGKDDHMPEEVAHLPLFLLGNEKENVTIFQNLENTALRIEKQGKRIRLLCSNGSVENPAFKEVVSREMHIQPNYIGLFALKGFVDEPENRPAHVKLFRITENPCTDH